MKVPLALIPALAILPLLIQGSQVPRKAADLSFRTTEGQIEKLSSYRGKVIALEFILTTCPHCQAAAKVMTQLQNELGPRGFQAIDIAVNQDADKLVADFKRDFQVGFPVGYTDALTALKFLDVPAQRLLFPQLVLIDRQGTVRYQSPVTGDELVKDSATLRDKIHAILTSRESPRSSGRQL